MKFIILGSGGIALNCLEFLDMSNLLGIYVDEDFSYEKRFPIIESLEEIDKENICFYCCVSDPELRIKMLEKMYKSGIKPGKAFIQKTALISENAVIGDGSIIGSYSVIPPYVEIGENCLLMHNIILGHHDILKDNVIIGNNTDIGCEVEIEENTYIEHGVSIARKLKIEKNSFLGMGAKVFKNVPEGARAIGNPARILKI